MKTEEVQSLVSELLQKGGFELTQVQLEERSPGEFYLNLASERDAVSLIGRNGEVLLALQHLLKSVLRHRSLLEDQEHLKIDVDSYRAQQENRVLEIADSRAQQVVDTGRSATLPPMSPFFRRLVHLHIKERFPQLATFSQGQGNYRSVCISAGQMSEDDQVPADLYNDLDL